MRAIQVLNFFFPIGVELWQVTVLTNWKLCKTYAYVSTIYFNFYWLKASSKMICHWGKNFWGIFSDFSFVYKHFKTYEK